MPSLRSVNLTLLTQSDTRGALKLLKLSESAHGPLRLQESVKDGVTIRSLGVRSWPTYFFETFIAWPCEINEAELKAQKAIDQYVRPFLNDYGLIYGNKPESITEALQSRVVGTSISPNPIDEVKTRENDTPDTRAGSGEFEIVEKKGKTFSGTGTVPTGLSVAVVRPLQMIADVRLVTRETFARSLDSDATRGLTCCLNAPPTKRNNENKSAYEQYYLAKLEQCAGFIKTSVVIELQPGADGNCPTEQQNGAWTAAKHFVELQKKKHRKQISIMLTVPTLPSVSESYIRAKKDSTTSPETRDSEVLVSENESESGSDAEYSNEEI